MARIRSIKPEFPQSETTGKLSRDARLLFIQLWTIVDDDGRTRAASRMLASLLYPYDDDAPVLIEGWLSELEAENCVRRYVIEGSTYLEIINWLKHQKIDHPSKSRLPPFDEASRLFAKPSRDLAPDLGPRTLDLGPRIEDTACAVPSPKKYEFESGIIRLSEKDFGQWKESYSFLDLRAELLSLTDFAQKNHTKWFFALAGALAKRNRDVKIAQERAGKGEFKLMSGMQGVI